MISSNVGGVTKAAGLIATGGKCAVVMDWAYASMTNQRPGPVVIEVPMDVQGAKV